METEKKYMQWKLNRNLTDNENKTIEIIYSICSNTTEINEQLLKELIIDLLFKYPEIQKEFVQQNEQLTQQSKINRFMQLKHDLTNKIYS